MAGRVSGGYVYSCVSGWCLRGRVGGSVRGLAYLPSKHNPPTKLPTTHPSTNPEPQTKSYRPPPYHPPFEPPIHNLAHPLTHSRTRPYFYLPTTFPLVGPPTLSQIHPRTHSLKDQRPLPLEPPYTNTSCGPMVLVRPFMVHTGGPISSLLFAANSELITGNSSCQFIIGRISNWRVNELDNEAC